ncbi:Cell division protein FtsL [Methylophaga frappieri]|uniref:Cell division protein FtsL n=1 Tax=Methylophaga frappieri (strain ATCC BAA-2434 / DSM 25690 / JAM7) TaxID=754477 RepID=I1YGK2_METFJ|nr:cell division protein FtsL [Methylophaga frappieri]AFJ02045.1 Cell division protein FtsL [Methylophaga frappieri]
MMLSTLLSNMRSDLPLLIMMLLVLASAVAVVVTKHTGRSTFVLMQQLENERDALNEEWGRLLLEQSTWGSPGRVEQQARQQLDMYVPTAAETVMVTP